MRRIRRNGLRLLSAVILPGLATALLAAGEALAQDPPPRRPPADTVAAGEPVLPADSAAAAAADTLEPVVVVPRFPRGTPPSWRAGVWEWDRPALLASGAVTLTELLSRIPGVHPIRYGLFGSPQTVNAWGMTGGRLEVVLDGFALDPLDAGVHDFSRIELVALSRVRVERSAGRLRVELETIAPSDPRPYSMIDAGTGQPDDAKTLRGLFQAPHVLGGPLSLAMERVDSDGLGRAEPANTFATWLKWGRVVGTTGLQLELRRARVERTLPDGAVVDGSRLDWMLRARGAPAERITTEAFFGFSGIDDGLVTSGDSVGEEPARTRLQSAQGGVRAAFHADRGWSRATLRLRSHRSLPALETELSGGLQVLGPLHVSGTVGWTDWRNGTTSAAYGARAELGPFFGLRPFAELSGGRRGVPFLRDTADAAVLADRSSFRAGAEFERGGLHVAGAFVRMAADSVPAFGLPFDRGAGLYPGGELNGWEVTARIPLFWEPLALEGWRTQWTGVAPWIYLPAESWHAALVYSHSPLPSGNLDVQARLEAHHRGALEVPAAGGTTARVPAYTSFDAYLQLRILSVWAFVRWENLRLDPYIQDFPERAFPRQRVFYGVKWEFWN